MTSLCGLRTQRRSVVQIQSPSRSRCKNEDSDKRTDLLLSKSIDVESVGERESELGLNDM